MYKFKFALIVLTVFCLGLLSGCKGESEAESESAMDDSGEYAKVNDVIITKNEYEQFANTKRTSQPEAKISDTAILDELVATELLKQEAISQGIPERPEIIEQLKRQESNILINALITEKFADLSFSDEELKTEYDRLVNLDDTSEYKARHILLQTEEEAKAVVEELNGGADFTALAKQKSQGPSAPNGGDLGWFKANTMVPPFAQAIQGMDNGAYTKTPVQTRFGWHVILLEDKRTTDQPAFEEVKQDVQRALTRKSIESYVDELQSSATIVRPDSAETEEDSKEVKSEG